jgi:hypothetical protein
MTDPQIFAFLVMPFLFVLIGSMVFFSHDRGKPEEFTDPPAPVPGTNVYARKPRKRRTSAQSTDTAED